MLRHVVVIDSIYLIPYIYIIFLKTVLGLQQIEWEVQRFLHTSCPYTCIAFPVILISHQCIHLLQLMNYIVTSSSKFAVYIEVHSWCCTFTGLGKCIIICIHHYITESLFIVLKNPLCSTYSPLPQSLETTDLSTVSILFPFSECHRVGIMQYLVFLD